MNEEFAAIWLTDMKEEPADLTEEQEPQGQSDDSNLSNVIMAWNGTGPMPREFLAIVEDTASDSDIDSDAEVFELDDTEKTMEEDPYHLQDAPIVLASQMYTPEILVEEEQHIETNQDDEIARQEMLCAISPMLEEPQPTKSNEDKPYSCNQCDYTTRYRHALKVHITGKHENRVLSCDQCSYTTKYATSLKRHRENIHKGEDSSKVQNKCSVCDFKTTFKHNLRKHERTHRECTICKYVTQPYESLNNHMAEKHGSVTFKSYRKYTDSHDPSELLTCNDCDYTTKFKENLSAHMAAHMVPSRYKCAHCPHETKFKTGLQKHIKDVHTKIYIESYKKCDLCNYTSEFDHSMNIHYKRNHECNLCGYKCAKGESLNDHILVHYGKTTDVFIPECQIVEDVLNVLNEVDISSQKLEENSKDKSKEKKALNCQYCNYSSKNYRAMRNHVTKTHGASKNVFECAHCSYQCMFKGFMEKHMRRHLTKAKGKRFLCEVCQYKTAYWTSYHRHMKTHTKNIEGYSCNKCTFRSKHEGRLTWHLEKIHKIYSDNQFKCDHCKVSTATKWRLNTHLKRNKINLASCGTCGFSTEYKCEFKQHLKTHKAVIRKNIFAVYPPISSEPVSKPEPPKFENQDDPNLIFVQTGSIDSKKIKTNFTANQEKPFGCYQCKYIAKHKAMVQKHYLRHHVPYAIPFNCPHCDFKTKTKDNLDKHIKKSKNNFLNCINCGFVTDYKCEMQKHNKIHFSFHCNLCKFSCKSSSDLDRHISKHAPVTKCRYCDYTSTVKTNLLVHEAFHTGSKPFRCHLCSYDCVTSELLDKHIYKYHSDMVNHIEQQSCDDSEYGI